MRLFSIELGGADPEMVGDRCWAAGAAGIWEIDDAHWRVGVDDERVETFLAVVAELHPVDVTDTEAVELSTRIVDVGDVTLAVPPTVFGDGDHPTTVGCMAALRSVVRPGIGVLDVGCGTGVLAIFAARAGGRVMAIDVDPVAVAATTANAVANGVSVAASATPLSEVPDSFDVVVANITAGSIRPLLADLARRVGRSGHLIVSGILDDQWPGIEADLRSLLGNPSVQVSHISHDGWVTGLLRLGSSEL